MAAKTVKVVKHTWRGLEDLGRFEIQSHTPEGIARPTVCVPKGSWPCKRAGLGDWIIDPEMGDYPGNEWSWYILK